jgi:hypothetical protein
VRIQATNVGGTMGSFPSWFRAAPPVQRQASVFAVGRRVYVASEGDGLTHVALTDDAGADARTHLTDGTEVEILAWRPRKFDGTRYRVRVTREGFEGWLAGDNLRSTPVAISAPMEPPAATASVPRAMGPGDAGRRFGQRAS